MKEPDFLSSHSCLPAFLPLCIKKCVQSEGFACSEALAAPNRFIDTVVICRLRIPKICAYLYNPW